MYLFLAKPELKDAYSNLAPTKVLKDDMGLTSEVASASDRVGVRFWEHQLLRSTLLSAAAHSSTLAPAPGTQEGIESGEIDGAMSWHQSEWLVLSVLLPNWVEDRPAWNAWRGRGRWA